MASVSSLDADMKRLRTSRYTPAAAKEVRTWIEETLGEPVPGGDILEVLKDGTILCRLANLALPPPGLKFKKSPMPFIQMENISHFLRACEHPPFNLPSHDRFLTVDLFELKDPAQVLQCLSSFSRVSHSLYPNKFPSTIGPKRAGALSPTLTGASNGSFGSDYSNSNRDRGASHSKQTTSPPRSGAPSRPMSSAFTGPSSILYGGYMGGASQGNQGISFGARRQITAPAPFVPNLADKERKRREKEVEDERLRQLAEEAEHKRQAERAAEEERDRIEEEKRWEEETRKLREEEKRRVEQQKREWEDQERKWKQAEEDRIREEKEAQARVEHEGQTRRRGLSDARLRGQYLSEYQAEQKTTRSRQSSYNDPERMKERERIQELEDQLQEAKERERKYQEERLRRDENRAEKKARSRSRSRPRPAPRPASPQESNVSWTGDEREYLRKQQAEFRNQSANAAPPPSSRPLPDPTSPSSRPLPQPTAEPIKTRPLPDPTAYSNAHPSMSRTDRFLAQNTPPAAPKPQSHYPSDIGLTSEAERRAEDSRRMASQTKTKAGGWASKSLLEREMERERERQREWEAAQKEIRDSPKDKSQGTGAGQSWDVNQYGYIGGDSQNKPGSGIGFGAKRQIIGPRPPP